MNSCAMLLGKIAVEMGLLTRNQLDQALAIQQACRPSKLLGQVLRDAGYLSDDHIRRLLREQERRSPSGTRLGELAVKQGFLTETQLNEVLRDQASHREVGHDQPIGKVLVEKGHLKPEELTHLARRQGRLRRIGVVRRRIASRESGAFAAVAAGLVLGAVFLLMRSSSERSEPPVRSAGRRVAATAPPMPTALTPNEPPVMRREEPVQAPEPAPSAELAPPSPDDPEAWRKAVDNLKKNIVPAVPPPAAEPAAPEPAPPTVARVELPRPSTPLPPPKPRLNLPQNPSLLPPFDPAKIPFDHALYFVRGRRGTRIDKLVIHTSEGSFGGTISWFNDHRSGVSAHYLVARDGRIMQMVKEEDCAIHTGSWKWDDESIGIEHEGYAHKNTWTEAQMIASASLARHLCRKYRIPPDRAHIVGHCEMMPSDRTDPGPDFDFDWYIRMLGGKPDPKVRFYIPYIRTIPADVKPLIEASKKRKVLFTQAGAAIEKEDYRKALEIFRTLAANDRDPNDQNRAKVNLDALEAWLRERELEKGKNQ